MSESNILLNMDIYNENVTLFSQFQSGHKDFFFEPQNLLIAASIGLQVVWPVFTMDTYGMI